MGSRDIRGHTIKVSTVDAPSVAGLVPEKDNIFRIPESKGKWVILPVGNDRVKVIYFFIKL